MLPRYVVSSPQASPSPRRLRRLAALRRFTDYEEEALLDQPSIDPLDDRDRRRAVPR